MECFLFSALSNDNPFVTITPQFSNLLFSLPRFEFIESNSTVSVYRLDIQHVVHTGQCFLNSSKQFTLCSNIDGARWTYVYWLRLGEATNCEKKPLALALPSISITSITV